MEVSELKLEDVKHFYAIEFGRPVEKVELIFNGTPVTLSEDIGEQVDTLLAHFVENYPIARVKTAKWKMEPKWSDSPSGKITVRISDGHRYIENTQPFSSYEKMLGAIT